MSIKSKTFFTRVRLDTDIYQLFLLILRCCQLHLCHLPLDIGLSYYRRLQKRRGKARVNRNTCIRMSLQKQKCLWKK